MKVCPQCDRTYHDEEQNFCLMDGAVLVDGGSQPTVAIPASSAETAVISPRATQSDPPPLQNKKSIWLPLGLTVAGLLIGAVVGGAALYFLLKRQEPPAQTRSEDRPTRTTKITPAKTVDTPVPTPPKTDDEEEQATKTDPPIDAVPILWMTTGAPFQNDKSDVTTLYCPPNGAEYPVWGVDVYTSDSSVCTAAVHVGIITFNSGGSVKVEFIAGRNNYGGSERNGVTSIPFGEHYSSFVFPDRWGAAAK